MKKQQSTPGKGSPFLYPRQPLHDMHRLHTNGNHAQKQIEDVPRFALFRCPVVGIVGDAAGLVGLDLVAIHDPFNGGSAVDQIVIGFQRDM